MPIVEVHADLKSLTAQVKRLADAMDVLLYNLYGYKSDELIKQTKSWDPEDSEVIYADEDEQFAQEFLDEMTAGKPAKGGKP